MILITTIEQFHARVRDDHLVNLLKEAETICLQDLTADPDQPSLLNLRGLLALRHQQEELALASLTRAAALEPDNAAYAADVGDALFRGGRYAEAEIAFCRAVDLGLKSPDLLCRLSRAVAQQGRLAEALAICEDAWRLDGARSRTQGDLGDLLYALDRPVEALAHYERSMELDPNDADAYRRLGCALLRCGHCQLALDTFRQGVRARPDRVDLQVGVGEALLRLGSLDEAAGALRNALMRAPLDVAACRQFALVLEMLGSRDDIAGAWFNLGKALKREDRLLEATVAYRQALTRKPDHLRAHVSLGEVHLQVAEPRSAITHYETALALEPLHSQAHRGLGSACALLGDLERSFEETAWFDRHGPWMRRYFEQRMWDGSLLENKTILLWTNAGLGDTILMVRFARLVKERGARVLVECHRTLAPLIARMTCVDRVVAHRTPLPPFDVHALLASLPRTFQTRIATIPNEPPYLTVDARLTETWRQRLSPSQNKTIGLVWAADTGREGSRLKSVPLSAFRPLAQIPGVRFVSLQLGPQAAQLLTPPSGLHIERLLNESVTAADTAALIVNLDLVITVDTMVAHLAGALARPVWTLLPYSPAWLWLLDEDRSPWYPTMRLFRQTRHADWSDVLERVRAALAMASESALL